LVSLKNLVVNTARAEIVLPFFKSIRHSSSVFDSDVRDAYQEFIVRLGIEEAGLRNSGELTFAWVQKVKDKHFVPMVPEKLQSRQGLFGPDEQIRQ
jgi:hypothetical protein